MTKSEILNQVWADAAWRRPDSIILDEADWFQITTPSSPTNQMNGIYRSRIKTDVDQKIKDLISHYQKYGTSFRWVLTNESEPKNLSEHLLQNGLKQEYTGYGLLGNANELNIEFDPDITVKRIGLNELEEWVQVSVESWTNSSLIADELKKDVKRILDDQNSPYIYYSAYYKNQMVGTATLKLGISAHLFGGSVISDFRGKGIYRAMISKRAKDALERGIPNMTTHAISTTSAPILLKLGFEKINEVTQFTWKKV